MCIIFVIYKATSNSTNGSILAISIQPLCRVLQRRPSDFLTTTLSRLTHFQRKSVSHLKEMSKFVLDPSF